ncbi:MAG: hypothetical protein Q9227_004857 [Pyrenula ochraceoflavens]
MIDISDRLVRPISGPTVLLFGPLALTFDKNSFAQIRKTVVDSVAHRWILQTITDLPAQWRAITAALPSLKTEQGLRQLEDLKSAFEAGTPLETRFPLPNTILIPLVVITHLTQYLAFLKRTSFESDDRTDVFAATKHNKETLGLCTGLLSAVAVSSAGNKEDFSRYGAVAIRLGMLIGMTVDAEDETSELKSSTSLSTAWNSVESREEMLRILKNFPEAYVSVNYDENRATVTTAASTVSKLQQELRSSGIIASEVGLYGRFHAEVYRTKLDSILKFCHDHVEFQFPDASNLTIPTRSNTGGSLITSGSPHEHALRSILVHPPQWIQSFTTASARTIKEDDALIISFGAEKCVPPSLLRELNQKIIYGGDVELKSASQNQPRPYADSDIAIVGMACKTAGAENLEEFWEVLCSGKSQHKEVPKDRFSFETAFREVDPKRKWFGNFIDGHDKFDHKFFKKSPRESATMDPQQRHLLQIAYQAVEQSGYFHTADPDKNIGCYIGLCASDYENNIACHAPNAFSATGNLQGFIAGKVSHHFGWTGPGLTIDTACSSSTVAIHQACRAILSGECNAALAGGTHVMTNPLWFQNLAGASFLSLTGQCKPFDIKADGYCRGEGCATVFMKRLSSALADGDQIMGVIAASAVQQNQNCTPIFVPNQPSLANLFQNVTKKSRLDPSQISVVEAHGTGTAVGDPAEYDSVRQVLGGSSRTNSLTISSVKGAVGHIECTSGVVSLIKILLMIQKGMIPPQASFTTINPAIKATPADKMVIPTSLQPWTAEPRAALINNYGASGSNSSLVLTQSPFANSKLLTGTPASGTKYPFWFAGLDSGSLRRYTKAFRKFVSQKSQPTKDLSLSNISFNLARQSNRSLEHSLIFSVRSAEELDQKLEAYEKGDASVTSAQRPEAKPVVFCFGGQISTFVGLEKSLYERVALLRKHLDTVDAVARSLGAGSIFPAIYERSPVQDTVKLQTVLFAVQYASARSWIDSGIQPAAVVGHSFGELTALCVSQILSLEDALKMIIDRATLVRDAWGSDRGVMMALEADLKDVEKLLTESNQACRGEPPASIACYNGPRSFTIAGSAAAIEAAANTISKSSNFSSMKSKKLNVTNAFHCALVDPLLEKLEEGARALTFREPTIPLERATENPTQEKLDAKFVADHMRHPVYFNNAIQRLGKKYPSCVFLETSSNATITSMANRALGNPSGMDFQAMNISSDNAWNSLTEATVNLWKTGLTVQHWAHQGSQTKSHTPLLLPPYQFDESRHWLDLKPPPKATTTTVVQKAEPEVERLPEGLLTFVGYQDPEKRRARFRVNTMIPKYDRLIEGHIIAQTEPICPATVQLDLAIESVRNIRPDLAAARLEPQIQNVENQSSICVNPSRMVWIEVEQTEMGQAPCWSFQVFSTDSPTSTSKTLHTTGRILFRSIDDLSFNLEFARFERLFSHQRCVEMLQSGDVDEFLQNRNIYRLFAEIVDYGEDYRNLRKLVGRGTHSAGHVVKKYNPETWLDGHLADSFCQVGGIYVNCMTDRDPTDMFIATGIEQWIRSPKLRQNDPRPDNYDVFATHHRPSDKNFLTDVFVFNHTTGALVEVVLGINYSKVPKASMSKILTRLTARDSKSSSGPSQAAKVEVEKPAPTVTIPTEPAKAPEAPKAPKPAKAPKPKPQAPKVDITGKVKAIMADLSGLELDEIKDDSELADLGIDSLMGMEMAHEIEGAFKIHLDEGDLGQITDMPGLMKLVRATVGGDAAAADEAADDSDNEDSEDSDAKTDEASVFTPSNNGTGVTTPAAKSDSEQEDSKTKDLNLPFATVMEAFNETKNLTDDRIVEFGQTNYAEEIMPLQTKMCVALTLEAFDQLGCHLREGKPGQKFERISHPREHSRLVDYLYQMLEKEAQIINADGDVITRTAAESPTESSADILQQLTTRYPDQNTADKLTFYTGSKLADVLRGETDGIKLIFGTPEGRDLVSGLYGDWPLNRMFYKQMEDFLERLVSKLDMSQGPLKILEMGAGTGGTTKWLVPLLAKLNVPVEYTFTDLGGSFVAAARKKFKPYPFMKFRTHDIEKAPDDELIGTQHIVIASNAVHATHSLCESTKNMRKALRPDGLIMMLEMTGTLYWVDMIFGLFEGWWFFDDGRKHAVTHESRWEKDMQSVGYGHVDWTDGNRPENRCEKLIIGFASGSRYERSQPEKTQSADLVARQAVIDRYLRDLTGGFAAALEDTYSSTGPKSNPKTKCVLVTGATGSLGAHLTAKFALRSDVTRVVCLNRRSRQNPMERQQQSLANKGISLPEEAASKLRVLEADLYKPHLGLSVDDYGLLLSGVTDIVHNAWMMNAKWPIANFEPQLQIMCNLIELARNISVLRQPGTKVTFQFISSIATVGHWPLWTGQKNVPEERMTVDSVLPTGYGDAKYTCELMLDATLHQYPDRFRAMVVRPGQVAGSSTSGYWNSMEHLSFLIKSSQTLNALPAFEGLCSWTPVDAVAGTLADLVTLPPETTPYPVYHIDNPIRQPWSEMIPLLGDALDIPRANVIPFQDWVQRVRDHPTKVEGPRGENPAMVLLEFLDGNFLRMSCGGLLLDTKKSREHSQTLANTGPVGEDVVRLFIRSWKESGFLAS